MRGTHTDSPEPIKPIVTPANTESINACLLYTSLQLVWWAWLVGAQVHLQPLDVVPGPGLPADASVGPDGNESHCAVQAVARVVRLGDPCLLYTSSIDLDSAIDEFHGHAGSEYAYVLASGTIYLKKTKVLKQHSGGLVALRRLAVRYWPLRR